MAAVTELQERDAADPSAVPDLLQLDRQVCFALSVAARNVVALYRPLLEPMGLTHPQYLVMLALWERSPRSVTQLSAVLALDPGTLSPLLKRLERIGYVERRRAPGDERSLAVTLTGRGRELRAEAEQIPPAVVERLGMPLDDLERLHAVLTQVIAATSGARRVSQRAARRGRAELGLDGRVEQPLVVVQSGLHGAAELVDDGLRGAGFERVERGRGHRGRRDLVDVERGREVGVDEADVHADHLGALALELDPGRVRVAPGRRLRRRVGGQRRDADPGRHGQHVDERAAAVGGQRGGEGLGGRDQGQVVDLQLGPGVVEVGGQRRGRAADAGVVDHDLDVAERAGHGAYLRRVGDVELDRHQPRVGHARHVAHRGVDLGRAALEQGLGQWRGRCRGWLR